MYVGRDFHPADVGESGMYGFDFTHDLEEGETIVSAAWTCWAEEGTDADAETRLVGDPILVGDTITRHRVAGLLEGVKYGLQALVTTSNDSHVSLFSYVRGQNPTS